MVAVMQKEFISLFKSFKSITVVLFFVFVSYWVSRILSQNLGALQTIPNSSSPYFSSIRGLVIFFGFIFVSALSHDTINKEIETQTIRYIVPKTSRSSIVIGKFLGILLFWFFCISLSFIVISLFSQMIDIVNYLQLISFICYVISFVILLSTVISKPTYTMFLGVLLGLIIPVFGIWCTFTSSYWSYAKYIFPFYYVLDGGVKSVIPLIFAIILLYISIYLFNRRDL